MKKAIGIAVFLSLLLALFACTPAPTTESGVTPPPAETASAATATPPTGSPAETSAQTEASTPSPTPSEPGMYSSYAYLVSFDPDTGVAEFDYFDMLRGDEAVDYLVEHDGYTEAQAQSLVDDYADSEFVEKNLNNQLRAIDLDDVSLSLMFQPSGKEAENATPIPSTASDFRTIFELDPALLLDNYFYYITVESDGHVSLVEQVYWP
jgi:hypothetical protein